MKFTKKDFEKKYNPNKGDVEELYEPNGEFGGDQPEIASVSQVTTDTQKSFDDKSDFETDIPQTTDDYAEKAKNKSNTYPNFNMGYPYKNGASGGYVSEDDVNEIARAKMKKMLEDLVKTKDDSHDIVNKTNYSDVNRNNVPDINEIENEEVIAKTNDFLNSIKGVELGAEDLGILINHILTNVDLSSIPSDYLRLIKKNINA